MAKTIRANASVHQGYRTLAEIGRGAYGVVLKAEHRETGEIRAIKSLYDGAYDEEALRRFKAEAELMHGFDHPNIVRVHEVHLDALSPSIVMDFVDGPDVRQLIKRDGALPLAEVVHVACDMGRAFDHFHPDVVHRDLKPENILRQPPDDSGQASTSGGRALYVLTDFGIARKSDLKLTMEGQRGTPEYMSPEHVDGKELKPAADYWGLGVVLYEALTGRVPFELRSGNMGDLAALASAITTERAPSIRDLQPLGYPGPEVPDGGRPL
ncbi:MAG: serine/threonine-protein kinase, partial [Bacteroidota bacterium]